MKRLRPSSPAPGRSTSRPPAKKPATRRSSASSKAKASVRASDTDSDKDVAGKKTDSEASYEPPASAAKKRKASASSKARGKAKAQTPATKPDDDPSQSDSDKNSSGSESDVESDLNEPGSNIPGARIHPLPAKQRLVDTHATFRSSDVKLGGATYSTAGANQPMSAKSYRLLNNLERFHVVLNRLKAATEAAAQQGNRTESTTETALAAIQENSETQPLSLGYIFQQDSIDGRVYDSSVRELKATGSATARWDIDIAFRTSGTRKKTVVLNQKINQDTRIKKKQMDKVAEDLATFLERWPFSLSSKDQVTKRIMYNAVLHHSLPGIATIAVSPIQEVPGNYFVFTTDHIHPVTGEIGQARLYLPAADFPRLIKPLPNLPANLVVGRTSKGQKDAITKRASKNSKTESGKRCEDFIRFVQHTLHDKIMTRDMLFYVYRALQMEYLGRVVRDTAFNFNKEGDTVRKYNKKHYEAKYGTTVTKWYRIHLKNARHTVTVDMAEDMKGLTKVPFSGIVIGSDARARVAVVTGAMDQARKDNPTDPVDAWLKGCIAADLVNEAIDRGDPTPVQCTCEDEDASKVTYHTCLRCFTSVLCSTMQLDDRRDVVCEECAEGTEQRQAVSVEASIRTSVRNATYAEARAWLSSRGKTVEEIQTIAKQMSLKVTASLVGQVKDTKEIKDEYTGIMRECLPKAKYGRREDPFWFSPDAVFPYSMYHNERRLHTPLNVVPTALFLNMLKHVYVPGIFTFIVDFNRSKKTDKDEETLRKNMDDVYRCLRAIGYKKTERLRKPYSKDDFINDIQMWRSVVPPPFSSIAESKLWKYQRNRPRSDDTGEYIDKDRILSIIEEIEAKFKVDLRRATDGCPWPLTPATMPEDWSWARCWYFFTERCHREYLWCNRNFVQVDTTENLYLECAWQYCDPEYEDLFGLIMVIWYRHPLRMAVGKKVHGRQMRTGWKINPTSVGDRDERLNNILFETCITNYAKSAFPEKDYPRMYAELMKIKVPNKWFDPALRKKLQRATGSKLAEVEDISDLAIVADNDFDDDFGGTIGDDFGDKSEDDKAQDDGDGKAQGPAEGGAKSAKGAKGAKGVKKAKAGSTRKATKLTEPVEVEEADEFEGAGDITMGYDDDTPAEGLDERARDLHKEAREQVTQFERSSAIPVEMTRQGLIRDAARNLIHQRRDNAVTKVAELNAQLAELQTELDALDADEAAIGGEFGVWANEGEEVEEDDGDE